MAMRYVTRRSLAVVVAFALLGGVASSGAALAQTSGATSSAAGKIVFRVGVPGDMVSPNPFKAVNGDDYEMLFNAYDLLFNFGPTDLKPVPGIATGCNPSSDYKTWTCDIRSGVTWSDGQPLTAADVAFTYNFIVKNNMSVFTSYLPFSPTFTAPNATTLVWKSTKPTFAPQIPPWVPILPEHIWSKYDGDPKAAKAYSNVPAVGSGPFVLTSWTPGQGWTMEANKNYWGGAPKIDEIQYVVFDSQEAMVQALKQGAVDFADNLNPTLFNSLQGQPNIGLVKGAPSTFTNLAFNFGGQDKVDPSVSPTNNPVLQDLQVRLAITMGINKQAIVDKVWQGDAEVGSVVTLPSRPAWFYTPTDLASQAYNPAGANALLDQAGYTQKDANGIRLDKQGNPIVLNILTLPAETGSVETGQLIQADLQQIGIGVKTTPVGEGKATTLWYDGDFDAYIWGWGGDPDPDFILSIFTTSQCLGWSDGCYSDPTYDQMYQQQRSIFDQTQRSQFIGQMQQHLFDNVPEIVLNYPNYLQAYRTDRFTGYVPTPTQGGTYLFGWGGQYIGLQPVSGSTTSGSTSSIPTWVWIVIGAAVIAAIAFFLIARGRREEEEA
jgi:peptide/nickel transport system substrate-binding protein